ncbi:MAG: T9SS type A sorting domain-containing protein, partial [Bacteroidota bacterium]|nr:T9SS type A sorting domain-containing protein [Bacteroidota bacterium]
VTAPVDSDGDGMPDVWEDTNGLKKNDPADAQLTTVDGKYPNVEVYLNSLVSVITENKLKDALFTSAIAIQKTDEQVKINLNNSSGLLLISHQKVISLIKVYSITGSLMKMKTSHENQVEMQIKDLSSGIYIISVIDENGKIYSKKIVLTT